MKESAAHFIVGVYDFEFSSELKAFLKEFPVSGLAVFNSPWDRPDNIWKDPEASLERVYAFRRELENAGVFLAADQEGGRVRRFRGHFIDLPSAGELGEYYRKSHDNESLRELFALAARQLSLAGVQLDFAPVVDFSYRDASQVVGDRSFGHSLKEIQPLVSMFCEAFRKENIKTTLKHFPGHGPTKFDSHEQIARLFKPKEDYLNEDTQAFVELSRLADAIMTAHVAFEESPDQILSLDAQFLEAQQARFPSDKIWVTDDILQMKAVSEDRPWLKMIEMPYDYLLTCGTLDGSAKAIEESIVHLEKKKFSFEEKQVFNKRIARAKTAIPKIEKMSQDFKTWKNEITQLETRAAPILEKIHEQRPTS